MPQVARRLLQAPLRLRGHGGRILRPRWSSRRAATSSVAHSGAQERDVDAASLRGPDPMVHDAGAKRRIRARDAARQARGAGRWSRDRRRPRPEPSPRDRCPRRPGPCPPRLPAGHDGDGTTRDGGSFLFTSVHDVLGALGHQREDRLGGALDGGAEQLLLGRLGAPSTCPTTCPLRSGRPMPRVSRMKSWVPMARMTDSSPFCPPRIP